jgi:hypothetical protein
VLVTKDHKPNDDEEHRRIVDCGGDVVADSDGTSRVNGMRPGQRRGVPMPQVVLC